MSSNKKITCFSSKGRPLTNNEKCPDSDSCCQTAEQCRPDRLCVANKDKDVIVRAGCNTYPWSDNCAKICIEEDSSGILPRVNICQDGSYCCVKDTTCCVDRRGIFLNNDGSIKGRANEPISHTTSSKIPIVGTTSTTTSTTSTTALTETPTETPTDNATRAYTGFTEGPAVGPPAATTSPEIPQPASSGISQSAKFGIGFGVAFGIILLVLIGYFAWRNRQLKKQLQMNPAAYPTYGQTSKMSEIPVELPTPHHAPPSELDGYYGQGSRR
ncbi:hypothetical protein EMCG_02938 [[Emmonsia] crescens]|uniref:Mid2 domain-containing protein n=1 Tax=[Emmonsia] crescens TaxID=73230 RepID=A0A0G2HWC1_9EURO|nr:hypothetical protein EMCG_02938 [Emmonsia crescens UAMH 3008]